MSDEREPNDRPDDFSEEDLRRLGSWKAPVPPADFAARVMSRDRAQASSGARRPATSQPPLSRDERERRGRRRAAAAAVLGAAALSGGGGFIAWQAAAAATASAAGGMGVYLAALAFGGILLVAALVGGHDHDHHAGHHQAGAHSHDAGHTSHVALVLPFLSLRFWIFGLAFFGLTGAVLLGFRLTSPLLAAALATAVGLGFGYTAAWLFQTLASQTVGQMAPDGGHVGREGKLLLPVARGQRGMVRVTAGGAVTDLLAESDDDRPMPAGTTVLIVAMREAVAIVERSPTPSSPTSGDQT